MFARISNSWELVKASASVLRADKELLLFPLASLIGSLIVIASFALPLVAVESLTNSDIVLAIVGFLFYFVMYFVVIFFNTALVGAALIRMRGGDPTLGDGLRIAFSRIRVILGYAAISATVGVLLRALRKNDNIVGQIIASVLDLAWSVTTYLVIPILVVENVGPIEAIKRSSFMLKRTWGEQIVGNFSISIIFWLIGLGSLVVIGLPLFLLSAYLSGAVLIAVIALGVIYLVVLSLISSALSGIYTAAVYRYAAENVVSDQFDPQFIQQAFH